ncbi:DNA methyltransferase [Pseudonocardia sp. 73-21]|uniref:DNA methyltransferase n=1 Tax=Pseudonocardia sp. 73-21 TaxID=1895809 RepID=UPI000A447838|nr:DNA methyltransferase [Pseudonocardia sp. 73-21]
MISRETNFSNAFFEIPESESIDGGTTTSGPLWHSANTRWGHSMHTMCSYHGMFPAKLAHYFIQAYTEPGDLVVDPFSGRGTVALQARVEQRRTICNDLNPLAYTLSSAKAAPPTWASVMEHVADLEDQFSQSTTSAEPVSPDIQMLYHPHTLKQLCYLRNHLHTRPIAKWDAADLMLAGALAGIMHGSHRRDGTSQYLSISMPNTFSMSPTYVAKFIAEKKLIAPRQDVFERIRDKLARLYVDATDGPEGLTYFDDASAFLDDERMEPRSVSLVLTSPPYLQVVNYGTANWIRLWLLGVDEVGRERGAGRRSLDMLLDHRHTYSSYKTFMRGILRGIERVLAPNGVAAVVIGDVTQPGKDRVPLAQRLWEDVSDDTGLRLVTLIEDHLPIESKVSRIWGETKGQATDKDCILVLARIGEDVPEIARSIDWDEPYRDGGPDAAHTRLKSIRSAD